MFFLVSQNLIFAVCLGGQCFIFKCPSHPACYDPAIIEIIYPTLRLRTLYSNSNVKLQETIKKNVVFKALCSFFHYILFNIHNMTTLITSQAQYFLLLQFQMVPASLNVQLKTLFVLGFSSCLNSSSNSGSTHPVFDFSHRSLCFSSYSSLS